jgi:galactitol-specific phosphotransferase system IIB component
VNSYAEDMPSFEDFMIEYNNKYYCSNNEYISCMKITRTTCMESFTKAIHLCAAQKDTNSPMPSPVCITNNYIKFAKVNDKIVKSCEHIAAGITDKVIPKYMPNNALNSDAAQKTRSAH